MALITFNTPSQVSESSSDFSLCLMSVDMVLDTRCLQGLERTKDKLGFSDFSSKQFVFLSVEILYLFYHLRNDYIPSVVLGLIIL